MCANNIVILLADINYLFIVSLSESLMAFTGYCCLQSSCNAKNEKGSRAPLHHMIAFRFLRCNNSANRSNTNTRRVLRLMTLRWRFSGSRKKIIIFTLYSSLLKIDRLISIAVIQILRCALSIMVANEAVV